MPFDMMDAHQRKPRRIADGFRFRHTHQKRAHKPRPISHAHGIQVLQGHARLIQRLLNDLINLLDMFS